MICEHLSTNRVAASSFQNGSYWSGREIADASAACQKLGPRRPVQTESEAAPEQHAIPTVRAHSEANVLAVNFGKAWHMTRFLLAGAAALGMISGAAMAQTSTTETVTTTTSPLPAPVNLASTSTNGTAVLPDGDQTSTASTANRESNGDRTETTVTNTSYPFSSMITTTRKSTKISNGLATETRTTTNTFPPQYGRSPEVTTATRTYSVSSN
jgi:hypothetical protein